MLVLPLVRYYVSTPGESACVIEYVESLEDNWRVGYMYNINGLRHIEPKDSIMSRSLEEYKIGYAIGCMMFSNNVFTDMNNSFYCSMTYLIKNSPMPEKYKVPLGIMN